MFCQLRAAESASIIHLLPLLLMIAKDGYCSMAMGLADSKRRFKAANKLKINAGYNQITFATMANC